MDGNVWLRNSCGWCRFERRFKPDDSKHRSVHTKLDPAADTDRDRLNYPLAIEKSSVARPQIHQHPGTRMKTDLGMLARNHRMLGAVKGNIALVRIAPERDQIFGKGVFLSRPFLYKDDVHQLRKWGRKNKKRKHQPYAPENRSACR